MALHTQLIVREDAHLLFGFSTDGERQAFRQLVRISGVGARTALAVLSGMTVDELHQAVAAQDGARFIKVPGIGRKTAERLLLELRDKLQPGAAIPGVSEGASAQRRTQRPARPGLARRRRAQRRWASWLPTSPSPRPYVRHCGCCRRRSRDA